MRSRRSGRIVAGALAVALATSGCFATREDVRTLQGDIASLRGELARQDSARTAREVAATTSLLAAVSDSLRASNARMTRWQATVQGDLRAMQEQLLQIQELTGQSQRRVMELRADLEARSQAAQQQVPPSGSVPPSSAATPPASEAAPTTGAPGPNQLYQLAYDQLRRGSYGAARAGFEELLASHPGSDLAPDAQFYIAEAYAAERNEAAADSVYRLVVTRFPRAPRAATALYKHGLILQRAGRTAEARTALERVTREYPRSDEAELAREALRGMRG